MNHKKYKRTTKQQHVLTNLKGYVRLLFACLIYACAFLIINIKPGSTNFITCHTLCHYILMRSIEVLMPGCGLICSHMLRISLVPIFP